MAARPQARQRSVLERPPRADRAQDQDGEVDYILSQNFKRGLKFNYLFSKPHQQYSLQYWLWETAVTNGLIKIF